MNGDTSAQTEATLKPKLSGKTPWWRLQELGLIVVILILGTVFTLNADRVEQTLLAKPVTNEITGKVYYNKEVDINENKFLRVDNIIPSILTTMSWMGVLALGMTVVIISGGIDISVGSVMAISALGGAAAMKSLPEGSHGALVIFVGILAPLAIGFGCGLINGILIVGLRMHPFIVTLATMSGFRWIAERFVVGGSLTSVPEVFIKKFIAYKYYFHVYGGQRVMFVQPVPIIIMLAALGLIWVFLRHTVWGRQTYAVGGNAEAARYSGISVPWATLRVYLISGLCAGLAGMLSCGYNNGGTTDTARGYELNAVAAAVVGGASLIGGRGTALGAILGALIIQMIDNGNAILNEINLLIIKIPVKKDDTRLWLGIAIILAVAVDQFSQFLQNKRLQGKH